MPSALFKSIFNKKVVKHVKMQNHNGFHYARSTGSVLTVLTYRISEKNVNIMKFCFACSSEYQPKVISNFSKTKSWWRRDASQVFKRYQGCGSMHMPVAILTHTPHFVSSARFESTFSKEVGEHLKMHNQCGFHSTRSTDSALTLLTHRISETFDNPLSSRGRSTYI